MLCPYKGKFECESAGERKDKEIAFAGGTDGEEAAVRGNGEVAEGKPVENGNGSGLANGNVWTCGG
jgi:hypothetical protein